VILAGKSSSLHNLFFGHLNETNLLFRKKISAESIFCAGYIWACPLNRGINNKII